MGIGLGPSLFSIKRIIQQQIKRKKKHGSRFMFKNLPYVLAKIPSFHGAQYIEDK